MAYLSALKPSNPSFFLKNPTPHFFKSHSVSVPIITKFKKITKNGRLHRNPVLSHCTDFNTPTALVSETDTDYESEQDFASSDEYSEGEQDSGNTATTPPPMRQQRRRYRKAYPGEKEGITEEMRFVAMKLKNSGKPKRRKRSAVSGVENEVEKEDNDDGGDGDTWEPTIEGFLKYLVDSELVFRTVERIVDESSDVSYVYFRKTGLERSDCIKKDLEWLRNEHGNVIPEPSNPGVAYVEYLKELAENSPPLFLCHFYNIYFSHIAGGQVIAKQVLDKLLEGRELKFYKWDGDAQELLRGVREKLNALGEATLVKRWEKQMLKRSNKSISFSGADCAVNHIVNNLQFSVPPTFQNRSLINCILQLLNRSRIIVDIMIGKAQEDIMDSRMS